MNNLILQYSYLQVLDLLMNGVKEANPLVTAAMHMTASTVTGLLLVKLFAVALGVYCWRIQKHRLLLRINILFAVLVAWNLMALIVRSGVPAA
jgi:hypothetical protein